MTEVGTREERENLHRHLDHAPPPVFIRRWLRRTTVFFAILIALTAAFLQRNALLNWYARMRLQHAVMNYQSPIDVPIMTQLATDDQNSWSANYKLRANSSGPAWEQAESRLLENQSGLSVGSDIALFLHERKTPSGAIRLVALHFSPGWSRYGAHVEINARSFDVGTFLHPKLVERMVKETTENRVTGNVPGFPGLFPRFLEPTWGSDFKLFPGRPDPENESRFLIDYTFAENRDTVVCDLADDDSLTFSLRSGEPYPPQFPTTRVSD